MDFSNITTPDDYVEAAFLAREVAQGMLARLQLMKLKPGRIVDLGCGTGLEAQALAERYPGAGLFGLDLAQSFLSYAKKQTAQGVAWIVGDSQILPLRSHSVDLIFANLLLPWVKDPVLLLREWRRILRPQGLLLFSCLGPDTFKEARVLENADFLPRLADMHNVGDALLAEGFADPVLEVEELTLTFRSREKLQAELEKSGMQLKGGAPAAPPASGGVFPVTFEVVYGHAWCPPTKGFKPDEQGVVRIPVSQLRQKE